MGDCKEFAPTGSFRELRSSGETDDYGYNVVKDGVDAHDLGATILHQLGIDHEKLTYNYQGRNFRLTDVSGTVIKPILA